MKRKKKYGVVVISILLLVVAVTLLTYKASYSYFIISSCCNIINLQSKLQFANRESILSYECKTIRIGRDPNTDKDRL